MNNLRLMLEEQGIFIKNHEVGNKKVFMFPGHGAQYVGMLKELYYNNEIIREVFERADKKYGEISGESIIDKIFSNEEYAEKELMKPIYMQPAIFLADVAMYKLIKSKGYKPDYLIGHSLGEIAALCAAGCFDIEEGIEIAYRRAQAVDTIPIDERGGMISISNQYTSELAQELLNIGGSKCQVSIINSTSQFNISGPVDSLIRIHDYCENKGITAIILRVSHAFHSEIMRPAVSKYYESICRFDFKKPQIPVYSTIISKFYDEKFYSNDEFAKILSSQLVTPFSFTNIITDLTDNYNVGYFVELGPKNILSKLVNQINGEKSYVISTNKKKSDDVQEIADFEKKAMCYGLSVNNCEESVNTVMGGNELDKIKDIISYETMYPVSVIKELDKPFITYYAIATGIADKICSSLEKQFNIKMSKDDWLKKSISDIYSMVSVTDADKNDIEIDRNNISVLSVSTDEIKSFVLHVIEENTGYPQDMLEDDLDFEADLGIDSVKQGEILSKVQTEYKYEVAEGESVKDLSSIAKIVEYVSSKVTRNVEDSYENKIIKSNGNVANNKMTNITCDEIKTFVLNVIEENTGYPKDMLEDELDFEADLGIDSVKQGEILSRVQSEYKYEVAEGESIKDLSCISKIVDYVSNKVSASVNDTYVLTDSKDSEIVSDSKTINFKDNTSYKLNNEGMSTNRYVAIPYSKKKLNSENFNLNGKNVLIIAEDQGIITEHLYNRLVSICNKVMVLTQNNGSGSDFYSCDFKAGNDIYDMVKELNNKATVDVIINLNAIKDNLNIELVSDEEWKRIYKEVYNTNFYSTKAIYSNFESNKERTAYFGVSNIGGIFGLEKGYAGNPVGAISSGFIKALEKELRPFNCKMIDFSDISDGVWVANTIYEEICRIDKYVEVGFDITGRKVIEVLPKEIKENSLIHEITTDDVIVVTGGGRGIIYECIDELLEHANPKVIVTGRTDINDIDNTILNMSDEEFSNYRMKFISEMHLKEPELSPVLIQRRYEKLGNARILNHNLNRWKNKGYRVDYYKCDCSDPDEMYKMISVVKTCYGKVTGVINGAGLPSFGKIPKKDAAFAEKVVEVKGTSTYSLMKYCMNEPLKFFVSMGSISGRFGMDGQVDYSAAADLIVRLSYAFSQLKPETRFTVMGWSAWDEVGMASNEQVKKVQQEVRGLEYISVKEGRQRFINEIYYGGEYPEVLFYGKLGDSNMPLGQLDFIDKELNEINTIYDSENGYVIDRIKYPMLEKIEQMDKEHMVASKRLFIDNDIHLQDHLVEGKHVFAGVMHVETACEMLQAYLECNGLGEFRISDISNFNFYKFIKAFENNPLELKLSGTVERISADEILMHVVISSDFINSRGIVVEKDRVHSEGDIIAVKFQEVPEIAEKYEEDGDHISLEKYYDNSKDSITFGDSFRCITDVCKISDKEIIGKLVVPKDGQYFAFTRNADTIISPVTIDNIGRLMLFREFDNNGFTIVPTLIEYAHQYRQFIPGEKLNVYCNYEKEEGNDVIYSAYAKDEKGEIVFDIRNMTLRRIGRFEGNYSLSEYKEKYSQAV